MTKKHEHERAAILREWLALSPEQRTEHEAVTQFAVRMDTKYFGGRPSQYQEIRAWILREGRGG